MMSKHLDNTCACCWEKFGIKKKALRPINSTTEELMQLYIFSGFSTNIEDFPKTICSSCHRNLFFLKEGKDTRQGWGEKIAKVT